MEPHSHHDLRMTAIQQSKPTLTAFASKVMQAEERRATLSNQKLISFLIIFMVPTFSVLDYFVYPEHFARFLLLRILCTASALGLFLLIRSKLGKRCYRTFTVVLPLIPAFFISLMIYYSWDPGTPYYAGLTLVIVAIGFVFHWTFREALIAVGMVGLMYLTASVPAVFGGMDVRTSANFVNNCIFLAAQGIVIVLGCLAHQRLRISEFAARDRLRRQRSVLRQQRSQLQKALRDLKETERQLIQSEKMASLGQLCAGVIHEIGNPLNYSNQALYLLRKQLKGHELGPLVPDAIDDIQDSIERMKVIVSELREFSHKSGEATAPFEPMDAVQVALRMLGKELELAGIELSIDFAPGLRVSGVKNQIAQVMINLIQNSIQSMDPDKPEKRIEITGRRVGGMVQLSVRDNGRGIEPDALQRIFDPFYTTKEVGQGTGLGLSICFRIVEAHGGTLRAESVPGESTVFVASLPRLDREADETGPPVADDLVQKALDPSPAPEGRNEQKSLVLN